MSLQSKIHFHAGPIGAASALPIGTRLAPPLPPPSIGLVVVADTIRCTAGLFVLREIGFVASLGFSPETLLSAGLVVLFVAVPFPDEDFVEGAFFLPFPFKGESSETLISSSTLNSSARGVCFIALVDRPELAPAPRLVPKSAPERFAVGEFESLSMRLRGLGRAGEYA